MAYVQFGETSNAAGGAVSVTLTGVASGNYLVAWVVSEEDSALSVITTTAGSTSAWTTGDTIVDASDFYTGSIAYANATATGSVTIQGSAASGATWQGLMVVEIDNIDSFDSAGAITRDTTDPVQSGATTPASYNAMLVGFCTDWGTVTPTTDTGWTDIGEGMDYSGDNIGRAQYRVYTSGSGQASFNQGGTYAAFVGHAFFIESAGGGGPVIPVLNRPIQNMMGQ